MFITLIHHIVTVLKPRYDPPEGLWEPPLSPSEALGSKYLVSRRPGSLRTITEKRCNDGGLGFRFKVWGLKFRA